MYRIITSIILMVYTPLIFADSQYTSLPEKIKQDLDLLQSFATAQNQISGNIITVGGDPNGCHFNNIQDAIDAIPTSGFGTIHIATNKIYEENLIINDISITMIGGYSDCTAAGSPFIQPSNNRVLVNGSNSTSPSLRVGGDTQRNTIELKNLSLTNGSTSAALLGAGMTAFNADAQILLDNVNIFNNSGSGLAILGSNNGTTNTDIIMLDTVIFSNTTSLSGGGIYCVGNDASIVMGADSGLASNQVTVSNGKGGGAFISSGCSFSMYSAEMVDNTAQNGGGGLFVSNGAIVNLIGRKVCDGDNCLGDNIRPIRFNGNRGDSNSSGQGDGGAIQITGANTRVDMSQVWIDDNTAFHGGGISVHDSAQLFIQRFSKTCWNSHIDDKCNLIESNLASASNGRGGAVYNDNGLVLLNQVYFENNRADVGTAVYSTGQSAVGIIDGSIFNHNGSGGFAYQDRYVVGASLGAEYLITHSTFADNHATTSVLGVGLGSNLIMKNSIVHDIETGKVLDDNNPGTTEFECILAHENESTDGFGIFVGDPEFINRDEDNYHINASTSPAVDLCSVSSGAVDIDTDIRGWDDPTVINQDNEAGNIYDAGADETFDNDIIFSDSFELTGDPA